jgi:hypothetical protein
VIICVFQCYTIVLIILVTDTEFFYLSAIPLMMFTVILEFCV